MSETDIAWTPSAEVVAAANWTDFVRYCGLPDYAALAAKSSAEPEWYWRALAGWLGFRFRATPNRMMDLTDGIAYPRWCTGGTANLYDSTVGATVEQAPERAAVIWEGEDGRRRSLSYADLDRDAAACAAGLDRLGLRPGDVVAFYLPMLPETVVAFMACLRLGLITLPLFSGFGAEAVAQRLELSGARGDHGGRHAAARADGADEAGDRRGAARQRRGAACHRAARPRRRGGDGGAARYLVARPCRGTGCAAP